MLSSLAFLPLWHLAFHCQCQVHFVPCGFILVSSYVWHFHALVTWQLSSGGLGVRGWVESSVSGQAVFSYFPLFLSPRIFLSPDLVHSWKQLLLRLTPTVEWMFCPSRPSSLPLCVHFCSALLDQFWIL